MFKYGDSVKVAGWGTGIAFRFRGHPIKYREVWNDEYSEYDTEEEEDINRAIVVMVGDDKKHIVDIDDLTILSREDYCGECGQIGCTHDGLERDEL